MCNSRIPQISSSNGCQALLDKSGSSIFISNEWKQLQAITTKIIKKGDGQKYFIEFQSAMLGLLAQAFPSKYSQELIKEQKVLLEQAQLVTNTEKHILLQQKITKNNENLTNNLNKYPCYEEIRQSIDQKLSELKPQQ